LPGNFRWRCLVEVKLLERFRLDAEQIGRRSRDRASVRFIDILARVRLDDFLDEFLAERHDVPARVDHFFLVDPDLAFEQVAPQRVDVLPLLVHHVVVLEQMLTGREVLGLDLLLGSLDGLRHHRVLDGHAVFHPSRCIRPETRLVPKIRMRSSSRER
jgi:hypothetical protein